MFFVSQDKMKKKIEKIVEHKCNVFINRQLIYNYPARRLVFLSNRRALKRTSS